MSSFRPYIKRAVTPWIEMEDKIVKIEPKEEPEQKKAKEPSERAMITWMERELPDGDVHKYPVFEKVAVQTLLQNGYRKSYPRPNEVAFLPPEQVDTSHVIVRPSPISHELTGFTEYTLASFICGDHCASFFEGRSNAKEVKKEPVERVGQQKKSRKYSKGAQRGRFPKLSQKSILEQMMKDAEEYAKTSGRKTD